MLFRSLYVRPSANLATWDKLNAVGNRRIVAVAGLDAHANLGLVVQTQAGQSVVGVLFDPYVETFHIVRNYVLLKSSQPLSADAIVDAIRNGQSYMGFDLLADAGGFRFTAEGGGEKRIMGEEIPLRDEGIRLRATTPQKSRVVLFRNGTAGQTQTDAESHEFTVRERGVYRVEAYLDQLGPPAAEHPWIVSNPIYVR